MKNQPPQALFASFCFLFLLRRKGSGVKGQSPLAASADAEIPYAAKAQEEVNFHLLANGKRETLAGGFPCNRLDVKRKRLPTIDQTPQALLSFLASLRPKRFAEQNLGAGGIHFRRAREIRKGSRKIEDFVGMRRESGVPSVLRSKTLAQAEFSFAEQEKSERAPAKSKILWESLTPTGKETCRGR